MCFSQEAIKMNFMLDFITSTYKSIKALQLSSGREGLVDIKYHNVSFKCIINCVL